MSSDSTTAAGHASRGFSTSLALPGVSAPPDPNAANNVAPDHPSGPAQAPTTTFAWHPGALVAPYAAVAVRQQPHSVVSVPWGHGGCGGSGGVPPAADIWRANGHPYGGAFFRPVDVNQRPLTANQQGPPAGVAGVQDSTELRVVEGLQLRAYILHPGHLLAATGTAAGSGACGSVAAAGAAVRGYHGGPVGGAGADRQGASLDAFSPGSARAGSPLGMGCAQPGNGGGVAGAAGPRGGLWSRGVGGGTSGGGQPLAARGAAGARAGACSGGGASEAAELAAPDAQPGDTGADMAMRARYCSKQIILRQHVAAALWPGLTEQMTAKQSQQVLLHAVCSPIAASRTGGDARQQEAGLCVYPVKLARYTKSDFRLTGVVAAARALGLTTGDQPAVGLRRLPCGRVLLERWRQQEQGQGQQQRGQERWGMQRADAQDDQMPPDEHDEGSDEEYDPLLKRQRLQGVATGGPGTGTRLPVQGRQGVQAVAAPQHPVSVRGHVSVPSGNGGCGGSVVAPPAADLWRAYGHPYGGAPFRPVDTNQRPSIANQQGPPTGVQGSTGLGDVDGLRRDRLHDGQLLAAIESAAGNTGDRMAAGSGACGSGAAAGAAVRGYYDRPVVGAGADLQVALPHAFRPECARAGSSLGPLAEGMGCPQPGNSGAVAGAEDPNGGLWSRGVDGGAGGIGQPPAAREAAGAPAPGTCSGGAPPEAAGVAAPDARPGDAGAGVAMRAGLRGSQICLRRYVVAALWPGLAEQLSLNQPQQVLLHTRCTPAAARQTDNSPQEQEGELHVHPVSLVRYKKADFRLTGAMVAVRSLGIGNKEAVGLRRLACGRVLLERWWQQGQGQQQRGQERGGVPCAGAEVDEMPPDEGGVEYVPSPKSRRLLVLAPGGSGTRARLRAQGQLGAQAVAVPQQPGPVVRVPWGQGGGSSPAACKLVLKRCPMWTRGIPRMSG